MSFKKLVKRSAQIFIAVLIIGFLIPQSLKMPVENATAKDYNKDSFWYYPWGRSVTHKGVDIFARKGTNIRSSVRGIVISTNYNAVGGRTVLILGPKWRLHYFAHLDKVETSRFKFVGKSTIVGTVGNSGNAAGKPAHLHYSIASIIPYPWRIDRSPHGWLKMFFLNPMDYFKDN